MGEWEIDFQNYIQELVRAIRDKEETILLVDSILHHSDKLAHYANSIEKVIFNGPATIILFKDGHKSVSKCAPDDWYDAEKGFMCALLKDLYTAKTLRSLLARWVWTEEDEKKIELPDLAVTKELEPKGDNADDNDDPFDTFGIWF